MGVPLTSWTLSLSVSTAVQRRRTVTLSQTLSHLLSVLRSVDQLLGDTHSCMGVPLTSWTLQLDVSVDILRGADQYMFAVSSNEYQLGTGN